MAKKLSVNCEEIWTTLQLKVYWRMGGCDQESGGIHTVNLPVIWHSELEAMVHRNR